MFQVFQDDKPADHENYPKVHKSWNYSCFNDYIDAKLYAILWAQPVDKETAKKMAESIDIPLDQPVDLSFCEFPVMMTIREV